MKCFFPTWIAHYQCYHVLWAMSWSPMVPNPRPPWMWDECALAVGCAGTSPALHHWDSFTSVVALCSVIPQPAGGHSCILGVNPSIACFPECQCLTISLGELVLGAVAMQGSRQLMGKPSLVPRLHLLYWNMSWWRPCLVIIESWSH